MQNSFDDKQYPKYKEIIHSRNLKKIIKTFLVGMIVFSSGFIGGILTQQTTNDPEVQIVEIPLEVPHETFIDVTDLDRLQILQEETKQYWLDQEINELEIGFTGFVSAILEREFEFSMRLNIEEMKKEHLGGNYLITSGSEHWVFSDFALTIPSTLFDTSFGVDLDYRYTPILFRENSVRIYVVERNEYFVFEYDIVTGVLQSFSAVSFADNVFNLKEASIDFISVEGSS